MKKENISTVLGIVSSRTMTRSFPMSAEYYTKVPAVSIKEKNIAHTKKLMPGS